MGFLVPLTPVASKKPSPKFLLASKWFSYCLSEVLCICHNQFSEEGSLLTISLGNIYDSIRIELGILILTIVSFSVTCILFYSKFWTIELLVPAIQAVLVMGWLFSLRPQLVQSLVCNYTNLSHQFPGISSGQHTVCQIICGWLSFLFPPQGAICHWRRWQVQAPYS